MQGDLTTMVRLPNDAALVRCPLCYHLRTQKHAGWETKNHCGGKGSVTGPTLPTVEVNKANAPSKELWGAESRTHLHFCSAVPTFPSFSALKISSASSSCSDTRRASACRCSLDSVLRLSLTAAGSVVPLGLCFARATSWALRYCSRSSATREGLL